MRLNRKLSSNGRQIQVALLVMAMLSIPLTTSAAEVGEMSAEETDCRLENTNVEPPTELAQQFQLLPSEGNDSDETKKSVKVK